MEIKGKKVLVTGGAIRIGSFITRKFAELGARVIIHYHSSGKEADDLLEEIGGSEAGHKIVKADLSDADECAQIFAGSGPVDILINNASVYSDKPLSDESFKETEYQFSVNFRGPLELMKHFRGQCAGQGVIINMLDYMISRHGRDSGSYLLSKKCLAEATISAALQWAPGIRVNAIAPGYVMPPRSIPDSLMKKSLLKVPSGKAVLPSDIADACAFIVGCESITGEILYLDGGAHCVD